MTIRFALFLAAALALPSQAAVRPPDTAPGDAPRIDTLQLIAPGVASAALRVRVYLPTAYRADAPKRWPVLYLDDGQDAEAVDLAGTLARLASAGAIRPPIVVAIDAPADRMGAYGFSDRATARSIGVATKYGTVGANAQAYAAWLTHTLVPLVDARYRTRAIPEGRALLGWSLGGLSAFDIGWQYPERFARIGAFSPSLWLATERSAPAAAQRTRIAQQRVATVSRAPCVAMYLAVGTREETDDRDADGINDALDDAHDLVDGWTEGGDHLDGLRQRGVHVVDASSAAWPPASGPSVTLAILQDGEHRQSSWARMLPGFLHWAYGPRAAAPRCTKR